MQSGVVGQDLKLLGGGPPTVSEKELMEVHDLITTEQSDKLRQIWIIVAEDDSTTQLPVHLPISQNGPNRRVMLIAFYLWLVGEFHNCVSKWVISAQEYEWFITVKRQGKRPSDVNDRAFALMHRASWHFAHCSKCQDYATGSIFIDRVPRDFILVCVKCRHVNRRRISLFPAPLQAFCAKWLVDLPLIEPTPRSELRLELSYVSLPRTNRCRGHWKSIKITARFIKIIARFIKIISRFKHPRNYHHRYQHHHHRHHHLQKGHP